MKIVCNLKISIFLGLKSISCLILLIPWNAIIREKFDLPLLDRLIGVSTFLSKSDVCIEMHQSNEAHRTSVWD